MNELKHTYGRVVISVDMEGKNSHTFGDGTKIRLERQFDNFNRRETEPVNARVISGEYIQAGAEILIHHNALHDVNRIFDYSQLSGDVEASDIKYFSIPESNCFAWRAGDDDEWKPMKDFAFALRVFEPYRGVISGIEPNRVKDVLYILTGELAGNVCHTVNAADYEIIFQNEKGREGRIIRCRHFENECSDREELVVVSHSLTEKVLSGELLVGLSPSSAKPLSKVVKNVPENRMGRV